MSSKVHFMSWAVQDWRTSRVRSRAIRTGDHTLRLVYLELLFALHEDGGALPDDAEALSDELGLEPAVIAAALDTLATMGKIERKDGSIRNARVTADLERRQAFTDAQRGKGKRRADDASRKGGKFSRKAAERQQQASQPPADHQPDNSQPPASDQPSVPFRSVSVPVPIPIPTPAGGASAPALTPVVVVEAKTWSQEAADDWIAAYGGAPPGRYFKALESLVKREAWPVVRPVLQFWLSETPAEYVDVSKFTATFGAWRRRWETGVGRGQEGLLAGTVAFLGERQ